MLDAISAEVSIMLLIAVGMLLTRLQWIDEAGSKLLSGLTVKVGLPALIINNMLTEFTREKLIMSADGVAACFLSIVACLLVALLASRIFRIEENRRGAFVCMCSFSNAIFIGMPVVVALFGPQATPYALIYYVANASLFWSVGNYLVAQDAGQKGRMRLKSLFPIPLLVFLLSVVLIVLGVKLPSVLMKTAGYLGNMVTPISRIYTGYVSMRMLERGSLKRHKGYTPMLFWRFVIAPVFALLAALIVPVASVDVRNVILVQAAMPVMTQTTILAGNWNADTEYVAGGLLISMVISLAVIPILMGIIPYI